MASNPRYYREHKTPVGLPVYTMIKKSLPRLHSLAAQNVVQGFAQVRLFYLVVLAFGTGIALYFTPASEPPQWVGQGAIIFVLFSAPGAVFLLWRVPLLGKIFLLLAALIGGFALMTYRANTQDTLLLQRPLYGVPFQGCIVQIEPHRRGARLTLSAVELAWVDSPPARIRLTTRQDFQTGDCIMGRAGVLPPSGALHPGGYDFARHNFFQGLGASGFIMGTAQVLERSKEQSMSQHWNSLWSGLRLSLVQSIRATLPPEQQALVIVFLTGQKGKLTDAELDAMRKSGLAHLLAISGLHMGLLAGLLFGGIRFALALWPTVAIQWPIKKISAACAIVGCFAFLKLIGGPVPAERAFIMTALALIAIILDRNPFSFRLVFIAALVILLHNPAVIVTASFQLSFTAVLALIGFSFAFSTSPRRTNRRGVLWWFCNLFLCSLVASLATLPFVAFHFQTLSLLGIPANMLAVPWTGFVIMPLVLLCFLTIPLGVGAPFLFLLAQALDGLMLLAEFFGGFSLSSFAVPAFDSLVLGGVILVLLWLVLVQGGLRWLGLLPLPLLVIGVITQPRPVVLIDAKAKLIAVQSGTAAFFSTLRGEGFTRQIWLRYWGIEQATGFDAGIEDKNRPLTCDPSGCLFSTGNLRLALSFRPDSLEQDCKNVDLVIARYPVNGLSCSARLFDRWDIMRAGGLALWPEQKSWRITALDGQSLEQKESQRRRPWQQQNHKRWQNQE